MDILRPAGDLGLIALAIALAEDPVSDWLAAHPDALYVVCGSLHIAVMPLAINLLISPWVGASELVLSNERSLAERVLVWTGVGFVVTSFIVPGVLGMALRISAPWMFAIVFGPYVALGLVTWALARLDQHLDHRYSRQGANPPPGLMPVAYAVLWAYLVAVETMLMVVAHSGREPFAEPLILSMALFAGYAPTRTFLWFLEPRARHRAMEAVVAVGAFLHLAWRVAIA